MLAAVLHSGNGMVKKHKDKVISVSAIVFGHIPMANAVCAFANIRKCALYNFKLHQGYQVYLYLLTNMEI